jgi:hypothetical protein
MHPFNVLFKSTCGTVQKDRQTNRLQRLWIAPGVSRCTPTEYTRSAWSCRQSGRPGAPHLVEPEFDPAFEILDAVGADAELQEVQGHVRMVYRRHAVGQ